MLTITDFTIDNIRADVFTTESEPEKGLGIDLVLFGTVTRFEGQAASKLADFFRAVATDFEEMAEALDREQGNDV